MVISDTALALLRRPVIQILNAVIEGPASGSLELQIAATTGLSVRKVHRWATELALHGIVTHEDFAGGYLLRVNPASPNLAALRRLINAPAGGTTRRNIAELLRMPGAGTNVALLWAGKIGMPPLVIATVDDLTNTEQLEETRAHLSTAINPLLPVRPDIWTYRWSEYRDAYNNGEPALARAWRKGVQLAGADPLTYEAAIEAARASALRVVQHRAPAPDER